MIFVVNSYGGYEHSGESKLLCAEETLRQAHLLEPQGVVGIVPFNGETQLGPLSDMNEEKSEEGYVAEFTQGGVLVDPETGKANVVASTLDIAGRDDSGQIYFSDADRLRTSEEITLDPTNRSTAIEEVADGTDDPEDPSEEKLASIAGIAMPATKRLLVVQMIPDLPQSSA